ncbi:hypothetical protein GGR52DRAFT_566693 [Hypoxylon sp. FL1284]|nr:hypothetical protein GGR52DRAFT_566693 [Hypoxylon sp. FL1284]
MDIDDTNEVELKFRLAASERSRLIYDAKDVADAQSQIAPEVMAIYLHRLRPRVEYLEQESKAEKEHVREAEEKLAANQAVVADKLRSLDKQQAELDAYRAALEKMADLNKFLGKLAEELANVNTAIGKFVSSEQLQTFLDDFQKRADGVKQDAAKTRIDNLGTSIENLQTSANEIKNVVGSLETSVSDKTKTLIDAMASQAQKVLDDIKALAEESASSTQKVPDDVKAGIDSLQTSMKNLQVTWDEIKTLADTSMNSAQRRTI